MKLVALESLRGLMAMWVVVGHIIGLAAIDSAKWPTPLRLLAEPGSAVYVFIILSGFVVFLLLGSKNERYDVYLARRFLRIFPAYFVCLIISMLMLNMRIELLNSLPWGAAENNLKILAASQENYSLHLFAHLTVLHGAFEIFLPYSSYAFLGQAWSISLEWQFYLIAPLVMYALTSKNYLLIIGVFVVATGAFFRIFWGPAFISAAIHYFLAGMCSYFVWQKRKELMNAVGEGFAKIMMPCTTLLALMLTRDLALAIWCIVFGSLVAIDSSASKYRLEAFVIRVLEFRVLTYLGKISYSIYLSHMIVIYLIANQFKGVDINQNQFFVILLLVAIPGTIAFSHLLYIKVELPFIQMGKKFAQKMKAGASRPASIDEA